MINFASVTENGESFPIMPRESPDGQGPREPPNAIDELNIIDGASDGTESNMVFQLPHEERLPGLQARHLEDTHGYEPLTLADLGTDSFDLVASEVDGGQVLASSILEEVSELIFSDYHLHVILQDYTTFRRFNEFITTYRPQSLPLLKYYLTSLKAMAAMKFTESVIEDLKPISYHGFNLKFTEKSTERTEDKELRGKIAKAFHLLARDDLSAYITHLWMSVVGTSMKKRVTGLLPEYLKEQVKSGFGVCNVDDC